MSSIKFYDMTQSTPESQRRSGTVMAGAMVAQQVAAHEQLPNPNYNAAFANMVVHSVIGHFIDHAPDTKVTYRDFVLEKTASPDTFRYVDAQGAAQVVTIKGQPDKPKQIMNIAVPAPSDNVDILQGYGADVIGDLNALSGLGTNDDAKYFLATVMFRRCR